MTDLARTTVFMSGNSQAVRIPKEFRFDSDRVVIRRSGNSLVLTPEPKGALDLIAFINEGAPEGWAECLEEPQELPLEDIPSWEK